MVWSWHMVVEITVATADSTNSSCDVLVGGQSTSISQDLPAVRDLAISWNSGASTFGLAPRSSSSGVLALGSFQTRMSLKDLWGPAVLPLGGAKLFSADWSYSCSSTIWGLPGCRAYSHRGHCTRQMHFDPFQVFQFCQTPCIASCFWRGGRIGQLICQCSGSGGKGDWLLLWCGRGSNQSSWHVLWSRRCDG